MPLNGFADHFCSTFEDLLGEKVLVALSGGADSVALLLLMSDPEIGIDVAAAHVHHGVRGAEADGDLEFCEVLCRSLEVVLHTSRLEKIERLEAGREGTWRRLRYDALLDLKQTTGSSAVATGHHRDDVAEGVLVQLLRGGGPRALSGISERTPNHVIRPLLPWTRTEIVEWLRACGAGWREDGSNRDLGLLRNRVRHQILPELEQTSPSLRHHLVHLAGALASTERHLGAELDRQARWIDPWHPDGGVEVEMIRELAPPLRGRWLHAQAARIGLTRVTRTQLELFEQLIDNGQPRAVTLGGRWSLRLARNHLWLEPPTPPAGYLMNLAIGRSEELPVPGWTVRLRDGNKPQNPTGWSTTVSTSAVLTVRSPRTGDRLGSTGEPQKLSSLFARRLPRHLRRSWPVFCEDDRIYWIPGVWQDPEHSHSEGAIVEVFRRE